MWDRNSPRADRRPSRAAYDSLSETTQRPPSEKDLPTCVTSRSGTEAVRAEEVPSACIPGQRERQEIWRPSALASSARGDRQGDRRGHRGGGQRAFGGRLQPHPVGGRGVCRRAAWRPANRRPRRPARPRRHRGGLHCDPDGAAGRGRACGDRRREACAGRQALRRRRLGRAHGGRGGGRGPGLHGRDPLRPPPAPGRRAGRPGRAHRPAAGPAQRLLRRPVGPGEHPLRPAAGADGGPRRPRLVLHAGGGRISAAAGRRAGRRGRLQPRPPGPAQ